MAARGGMNPALSRRRVLALLAAAGAVPLLDACGGATMQQAASPRIIDVHHHIYPPHYTQVNYKRLVDDAPQIPGSRYSGWTPQVSLDLMDQNGVATAIGSITSPGIWFGDNKMGRYWARECNEYGARIAGDHPGRFGMFAAIPLPDTEGSLREIAHSLDVLKLDGIGLLSSYKGRLLGDPGFAPVFDELNRRKAVVFVHPTMSCCGNLVPGVNAPVLEFVFDTTRTITSLIYSGTIARCRDIRFIFPHGGGTIPMLVTRIERGANGITPEQRAAYLPQGLLHELQQFYYDTAGILNNPAALAADWKMAPVSQFVFGTDFPFGPFAQTKFLSDLDLPPDDLHAIQRGNAARLLPRFDT
jgi:predicted TIM-barrel fold metal-dependent hydrolase